MNSALKRTLVGIGITLVVVGLVFGGLTLYRNLSRKPVNVYPLEMLAMQGWNDYSTTTYGMVSSEGIQKVFLGDRQTVLEVLVAPGDEVHVGDPLLAVDTTLTGLDVKKAEIAVGKLELQVQQAQAELATLRSLRPHSQRYVIPETTVTYTPHSTPYIIIGQGLKGDPFIILWDENDNFSFAYMNQLIAQYQANAAAHPTQPAPAGEGGEGEPAEVPIEDDGAMYLALITRQDNALNAPILSRTGLRVTISGASASGFSFFDPVIPADIEKYTEIPQPHWESSGSWYTAAELVQLRAQKEQEIKKLTIEAGLARIELEKKKAETSDGFVRATIDGVVTEVLDPDDALYSGRPVVSISAGGGYYITGFMGEYDLTTTQVGQQVSVTVYDWSKGGQGFYTGTIAKISTFPAEDQRYYGGVTASTYPFTVFVDGSANISDNSYVEISYGAQTTDSNTFYVPNAFIRTEGGRSFVYVLGENDRLEERVITPGRDLWGNYTEILAGLTLEDHIAFPYGKDVLPGAKTEVQEDLTALYSGVCY
ncbi:MAG: hypothetical protein IKF96_00360 [Eggerthellaceae bacterium]|nr:hypothetical protein [Eggerthellaceae bacterium]